MNNHRTFEHVTGFGWSYEGQQYRVIVEREIFHEPYRDITVNRPMLGLAGVFGFTQPTVRTVGGPFTADYVITLIRRIERRQRDFALQKQVSEHFLQDKSNDQIRAGFLGPVLKELARAYEAELEEKLA